MKTANALGIALRSVDVEVPDSDGRPQKITVRLLRVDEFPRFFDLIDKESELVAFATANTTPATLESLPANSVLDLADKIFELNFTAATRWADRRARLGAAAEEFKQRSTSQPAK